MKVTQLVIVVLVVLTVVSVVNCAGKKKKKSSSTSGTPLYLCTGDEVAGDSCLLRLMDFKPTQSCYGRLASICKTQDMEKFDSQEELQEYLTENPIPVVIGGGVGNFGFYMTDHHHLAIALFHASFSFPFTKNATQRLAVVQVLENKSDLSKESFWRYMIQNNYTYLYDQNGDPVTPNQLPTNVTLLVNDPFRSLSYVVRKYGGYGKANVYFQEFIWGNFFRQSGEFTKLQYSAQLPMWQDEEKQLENSFKDAVDLAKSKKAKNLPGYGKGEKKKPSCSIWKHL